LLDFLCELYYNARIHEHHAYDKFISWRNIRNLLIPVFRTRRRGLERNTLRNQAIKYSELSVSLNLLHISVNELISSKWDRM